MISEQGQFIKTNKKVAGIYTPYDLVPGGGERYLLTTAEYLINSGYEVFLILEEIYSNLRLKQMSREFNLSLDNIRIITLKRAEIINKFDIFISMGNSIVPSIAPLGKYNIFICQFPFPQDKVWIEENSKNFRAYQQVIVYSDFVLKHYKELLLKYNLPDKSLEVIYPPCELNGKVEPTDKSTDKIIILTVGRFFTEGHCKRQDFLIEAFIEMVSFYGDMNNVEFHIAGSMHPTKDSRDYFTRLKEMAKGFNIYLHGNIDANKLNALYKKSHIYWHATGVTINPAKYPEMLEHFGITIVEAMASGCIPIVVNKGGPPETVRNGINGFCFDSKHELIDHTLSVIKKIQNLNQKDEWINFSTNAINRANEFTKEKFYERIGCIIKK